MNKLNSIFAVALLASVFTACSKDEVDPIIVVPPSDGSTMTLRGIAGTEDGASAANSVYVDFSANKQTPVLRSSWDLGFYSGAEFKVALNATNGASVTKLTKTDLNAVTEADLIPANLTITLGGTTEFGKLDDPREANILNKTAISSISSTDAENTVYLINPAGGSHTIPFSADNVYKIRILRKGAGYSLQYAKLKETTFKTLEVTKDSRLNFSFVSLSGGKTVTVEPAKAEWDIVWTWSLYYGGNAGAEYVYSFSDLVFTNNLGGATTAQVTTKAYADFSESDLAGISFDAKRDLIGSTWRITSPAASAAVRTDRFYLIKDGSGNVYKLKFNSFHANDAGTRGKPVLEYKLVKKG
jgi:hypothetical protein